MTGRADFWARRKAAVQAEEVAEVRALEQRATDAEIAALAERPDEEILAELNLPDPDTLQAGDDIRGFMVKTVPDRLRRRALRQLWKLNPVLANVDGLVDYGEDFTDAATVIENLQTAYQVGKGMLAHIEEMARQAEAADAETQPPQPAPEDMAALPDTPEAPPVAEPANAPAEPRPANDTADVSEPVYSAAAPRRMRFAFEG